MSSVSSVSQKTSKRFGAIRGRPEHDPTQTIVHLVVFRSRCDRPSGLPAGGAAHRLSRCGIAPRELWDAARNAGLTIVSEGAGKIDRGLNRRAHHAEVEAEVKAKLELAVQFGIPNIIVFSGNREGLTDEAGALVTAEGLRRLRPWPRPPASPWFWSCSTRRWITMTTSAIIPRGACW